MIASEEHEEGDKMSAKEKLKEGDEDEEQVKKCKFAIHN
jgi:hypothetical protein